MLSETIFHYNAPTLSQTSGLCTVLTQVKADGLVQVSDLYSLSLQQGLPPENGNTHSQGANCYGQASEVHIVVVTPCWYQKNMVDLVLRIRSKLMS